MENFDNRYGTYAIIIRSSHDNNIKNSIVKLKIIFLLSSKILCLLFK
jgi:hypothetical protein